MSVKPFLPIFSNILLFFVLRRLSIVNVMTNFMKQRV